MTTVAVLGVADPLGRALLRELDADPGVERIIGVDGHEPPMPPAKLELRRADLRDRLLAQRLVGADAVVHLGSTPPLGGDSDTRFAVDVHGTRNVLAAAEQVGARALVYISSGAAYGAHPDNEVPLAEEASLRAVPEAAFAYNRMLAEELVSKWAQEHTGVAVCVLRPATVLGAGLDDAVTRLLEAPRLPLVRGHNPVVQVLHVDDLARAVGLAVSTPLRGVYNVAADGWLPIDDACALLGRRAVFLPETVAEATLATLFRRGLSALSPGALAYLMYPWVLDTARLREHGWAPQRSNREVLREFAAAHAGRYRIGRLRLRRRDLVAAGLGLGLAVAAAGRVGWRLARRAAAGRRR